MEAERAASMLTLQAQMTLRELELSVELSIGASQRVALVGPSGAGKSTVLRLIAGLRRPRRGKVTLGPATWLDSDRGVELAPERRRCGFLFQSYALFDHLSVRRNVAYGLRRVSSDERRRRSEELLGRFGIEGLAEARPRELSGGERQRVALARALAPDPAALLLDEPLSALDPTTRGSAIRELASMLAEVAVPTLIVTHDFSEAALLADRLAVMEAGQIVQSGTAAEVAARPASAFVAAFAGAAVLTGEARRASGGLTEVMLDGGGVVSSADPGEGRVAASVFPWEIAIEVEGEPPVGSALNRLPAEVTSVTEVGNRVRLGLAAPQPLAAEITAESARSLGLVPGSRVTATWKATATRLAPI